MELTPIARLKVWKLLMEDRFSGWKVTFSLVLCSIFYRAYHNLPALLELVNPIYKGQAHIIFFWFGIRTLLSLGYTLLITYIFFSVSWYPTQFAISHTLQNFWWSRVFLFLFSRIFFFFKIKNTKKFIWEEGMLLFFVFFIFS